MSAQKSKGIVFVSPCKTTTNKMTEVLSDAFNNYVLGEFEPWRKGVSIKQQAEERLSVITQLVDEGYDVRIVVPTIPKRASEYLTFLDEAKTRTNNLVQLSKIMEDDGQLIEWIADAQKQLGDSILIPPAARDNLISKLGHGGAVIKTHLGEGGKSVFNDEIALLSTEVDNVGINLLKKSKITPYIMDSPITRLTTNMMDAKWGSAHVDTHLNVIKIGNNRILIANEGYYNPNKAKIDEITTKHNYELVTIPKDEEYLMPANFLRLPDGRLFLNNAPKFIRNLKAAGVSDSNLIVSKIPIIHNPKLCGSVGCFAYGVKKFTPVAKPDQPTKGSFKYQKYQNVKKFK